MKHTHLSNFQKQQYTAYLETQLEKFSTFMLSQKKENEKYKALEEILSHHEGIIQHLQSKYQMIDLYQSQVQSNQEALFKKCEKMQDYQIRLTRLEDRDRFDCDREARKNYQNYHKERREQHMMDQKQRNTDISLSDLNKRIKNLEEKINKQKDATLSKNNNLNQNEVMAEMESTLVSKIKKTEKKMKKYFASKFEDIQILIQKAKKNKSKSPKHVTPKDISISSRYEMQCSETPLTQFKLEDNFTNKSELSTVLRESKNTTVSNRNKAVSDIKIETKKAKKSKKDDEKSNRSKSKSKNRDKSKGKKKNGRRSRSHSKSQILDQSYTISEHSCCHSSVSRSRSNLSKQEIKVKKSRKEKRNKSKENRSVSKSKSDRSSISLHEKCKKRPQFGTIILQTKEKSKEKKVPQKKVGKHYQ